jgi:hypothetical protein
MAKRTAASLVDEAYALLQANPPVATIKLMLQTNSTMWSKVSPLVFKKVKAEARKERDQDVQTLCFCYV